MNAYPPEIQSLFDQTQKFDKQKIAILDEVSALMQSSDSSKMMLANAVWKDLKEKTEFWINGDVVLEISNNYMTKVLTLVLMEETIKLKWLALPEQAREGLKNYMVNYVFKTSQAGNLSQEQMTILSKCNSIIIKILTFEWNSTWKSFIPDICQASRTDSNICENSLHLLKMLSEEIFDHSKNEMTSVQVKQLKETMHEQFKHIYDLCYFIASGTLQNINACKPSLIKACLETFHVYLSWIPLVFVIETDIVDIFLFFTGHDALKEVAIQCLMEIALLKVDIGGTVDDTLKMKNKMIDVYFKFISKASDSILPFNINLAYERKRLQQMNMHQSIARFESLCSRVALFLTSFFSTHLEWVEELTNDQSYGNRANLIMSVSRGLQYIVNINEIDEENIFKICTDYWHQFTGDQLHKQQSRAAAALLNGNVAPAVYNVLRLNNQPVQQDQQNQASQPMYKTVYPQILTQIRVIISSRMAKPQEVLIVIEDGVPVREDLQDTENNSLYDLLKEILMNLSKLDWQDMSRILLNKLEKQLDGSEWSFDNLNSLCWAIGSISGSVKSEEERTLLIQVIKGLLTLTEQKKQKESKAVVASNIMYVVSQYPVFLKNNWSFLKTVVKKLFEFMNESFPGVMEMAVNTFLTVCKKCAEEFVKVQLEKSFMSKNQLKASESEPYILGLIRQIDEKSAVLELQCKLTFYEAIGFIINAEKDQAKSQVYLESSLRSHLEQWKQIIINAQVNPTLLIQPEVTAQISLFLRIADRMCFSVGYNFIFIIGQISLGMNEIYKYYSQNINSEVKIDARRLNHVQIKKMRMAKKEIIKLYVQFFSCCKKTQPLFSPHSVVPNLVEPLQQLLLDYVNCLDECRESELLSLYQVIFENMAEFIQPLIPDTLQGIFMSTLSMITKDFSSFPEHRLGFFRLLKAVVQNAIEALFNIPSDSFKTMIDCIVWAFKHHLPEISDIGLDVLVYIMRQVNTNQMIANQFYKLYYANLLKDVLEVLTDGCHKSGFKQQCILFQMLIAIAKAQEFIQQPLFEGQTTDNATYVFEFLVKVLSNTFNNVSLPQTQMHIKNLFDKVDTLSLFKIELRDYLINLTMYTNDNTHLFDASETSNNPAVSS